MELVFLYNQERRSFPMNVLGKKLKSNALCEGFALSPPTSIKQ